MRTAPTKLDTIGRCRSEAAQVYRLARSGKLPVADATKLIWMLDKIAGMISTADLERRVDELEATIGTPPDTRRTSYGANNFH